MGFFVLAGLIIVGLAVAWVALSASESEAKTNARTGQTTGGFSAGGWKALAVLVAIVAFVFVAGCSSVANVETGHIGIKKQFSAVTGTPTGDGLQFHAPWQSISQVSTQNEKRTYKMGDTGIQTGNVKVDVTGGSAVSKDSQPISLFVQVNYQLDKSKAVQLYRSTGGQYLSRVLDNAVLQHTKAQTAKFTATEFAANREVIRQNINTALTAALESQGIAVLGVSLLDVGYSPGLAQAIERTVEAKQKAVAAEAQVKVVQAEAEQKVAAAQGDASALLTNARATSKAQKLRQKTLTNLLVQEEAIKTLNPNVQVIVCAAGKVCIPQAVIATADAATK